MMAATSGRLIRTYLEASQYGLIIAIKTMSCCRIAHLVPHLQRVRDSSDQHWQNLCREDVVGGGSIIGNFDLQARPALILGCDSGYYLIATLKGLDCRLV